MILELSVPAELWIQVKREMIYPGSSCNFCQLQDTELSDLIDKGNAELTFETRKPYFDEYQEKVVEKAAMGYLYTKNLLTAYNKKHEEPECCRLQRTELVFLGVG